MTDNVTHNGLQTSLFQTALQGEMRVRIISGIALAVVGIGSAVAGQWPFAIVVASVATVMAWEWARVVRRSHFDDALVVHVLTGIVAAIATCLNLIALGLVVVLVGTAVVWTRSRDCEKRLSTLGVPYTCLATMGLIWLRADGENGLLAILFLFACVCAHDTFAMLVGRAVGGPRLWPSISPKKTWSGLAAGLIASAVAGALMNFYIAEASVYWLIGMGFLLGLAAFIGDLAESGLKRVRNVKDASNLIPGHGGFLDRMDGAVAGVVVAVAVACCIDTSAPAHALLYGF